MRVNGEIVFSGTFLVDKERDRLSNFELKEYQKKKMGCELGQKIAEEKGWDEYEEEHYTRVEMHLYVFTPQELKDFIDVKFAKKLEEMGIRENTSSR